MRSAALHANAGGAQHAPAKRVAVAEDVGDDRLAIALAGLQERLVELGVERLALGVDLLEPIGLQRVRELREHQLHPVEEPVVVRLLRGMHQRELELVEHLEEPAHHRFGRELHGRRLLTQHALAVVVEFRLETLQVLEVGLRLPAGPREVVGDLGRLRGRRCVDGRAGLHGRLVHGGVGSPLAIHHEPPPSSTISPSTTSSSPDAGSVSPPSVPADALASAAGDGAFWYIACPTRLKTPMTLSDAPRKRSASAPWSFRTSFSSSVAAKSSSRSEAGTLSPHSPRDL